MAKKNRRRSYPKSRPRVAGDGEGLKRGKKKFGCGFGLSAGQRAERKKQKGLRQIIQK